MAERYSQAFVREVIGKGGKRSWKGVIKYREPNPDHLPKPEGEDTRTPSQKRAEVWRQKATMLRTYVDKKGAEHDVRTKSQAERALQQWREKMEKESDAGAGAEKTVPQFVAEYIAMRETRPVGRHAVIEESTALDYRKKATMLEPTFTNVRMGDVTSAMIEDWEDGLFDSGKSATMVHKAHALLAMVFKYARSRRIIAENPFEYLDAPATEKHGEAESLTREDMQLVTMRLEGMEPTPVVVAAYIALHAGLRCGEVCALRWRDVDFAGGSITVRKAIGYKRGGAYEKDRTKTGMVRVVDFDTDHMADLLRARHELMFRDAAPVDDSEYFVLGGADGSYARPTTVSRQWTALAKGWGLTSNAGGKANFHLLRHSFVTAQLMAGTDIKTVASNAGHASAYMTANTYASAQREGKRDAAHKSGAFMRPDEATKEPQGEIVDLLPTGTDGRA